MPPWKKKCRFIEQDYENRIFKPQGKPCSSLPFVNIGKDELEVIRLVDVEHLRQEDAAVKMGVSSGTIQRMIEQAREKIGKALINGYAISIEGGFYQIKK